MDKNTKITLEMLIQRKEQALAAKKKPKTKDIYVESLGGIITVKEPNRAQITDSMDSENNGLADRYLLYQCIVSPNLHDTNLLKEYGCTAEPDEIVDYIIAIGEQSQIVQECLQLAGFSNKVEAVKAEERDLKNS